MRFLKLATIVISAGALLFSLALLPNRLCFKGGESYTFYCGTSSADCKVVTADGSAALKKLTLKNVCGESAVYPSLEIEEFLKEVDGEIVFCEQVADITNYYCRANLPYSVDIAGQEINLHICVREDSVMVGTPIIFGGY